MAYQNIVLETAEEVITAATVELAETTANLAVASAAIDASAAELEALATGNLDLAAIQIGGMRFVNNAGVLELEP